MNSTLLEIFYNTKDWLKFAEAKNAMLIAFNGASIYGVAQLFDIDFFDESKFWTVYLTAVILFLVVSTITCLTSFVPRLRFLYLSIVPEKMEDNIFFFENLKDMSEEKILKCLTEKGASDTFTEIDKDLANQIQSLAKVASTKYSLFLVAVWITVIAYASPVVAFILWLYNHNK
ncbi:Pycsar system effector family protein [Flagellimonas olearia]|uniref:Pycsar effector protein domain-containing protein n=1 Tax=Flagellimonas olearia TaxID=552546 RepID=A0A444VM57_9FLAO|nr:Pycsar system effector family protein [Allomuricauda olearia]RYC51865.1 hypothetical protein DN53_08225 [Allomuricauda olearia]